MPDQSLALTEWVVRNNTLVLRQSLDVTDPESWPAQWMIKFRSMKGFDWRGLYGKFARRERNKFIAGFILKRKHEQPRRKWLGLF
jgi:hypothetical protein